MRLNQIARKLNIGIDHIVTHLHTQGMQVEATPNTKLTPEQVGLLTQAFASSAAQKAQADKIAFTIKKPVLATPAPAPPAPQPAPVPKRKKEAPPAPAKPPTVQPVTLLPKRTLKVLDKIDLGKVKGSTTPPPPVPVATSPPPPKPLQPQPSPPTLAPPLATPTVQEQVNLKGLTILGKIKVTPTPIRKKFLQVASSDKKRPHHTRKRISPANAAPALTDKEMQKKVDSMLTKLQQGPDRSRAKYRKEKREKISKVAESQRQVIAAEAAVIKVTENVTAHDFAKLLDVPITDLLSACMDLGVIISINQTMDAELITLVAQELEKKVAITALDTAHELEEEDDPAQMEQRAPIVTIMGHVDHGKTSLLDRIRQSDLTSAEVGGITQRLAAYDVMTPSQQRIVFLDTPGHEAFTAMRARGAQVTDIAIILIAADDGIMPQTKEAITHAQLAGVPLIMAINKVDKPGANADKVREGLTQLNIMVEEWGGKYQCQEISAKTGQGVPELLEKILLEAEMLALKANPHRPAKGNVLEASLDPGKGYLTTVMVEAGTLAVGDTLMAGAYFGRVKALVDSHGKQVKQVLPATPVQVLGLNGAPQAGEKVQVMSSEREARTLAAERQRILRDQQLRTKRMLTLQELGRRLAVANFKTLHILIKGDSDGSVGALADVLAKLATEVLQVEIIYKGVGAITESDVLLAAASKALVIGFHVKPTARARPMAQQEGVAITLHNLIYDAIDHVKEVIERMQAPAVTYTTTGEAKVLKTFDITRVGRIAGCQVTKGSIKIPGHVRFLRNGEALFTGPIKQLKREKDHIKEAKAGTECGISVVDFKDIEVGDIVEALQEEKKA